MSKKCDYCKMDIPDNATICPYCNKKQPLLSFFKMSYTKRLIIELVIVVIAFLIMYFCGLFDQG